MCRRSAELIPSKPATRWYVAVRPSLRRTCVPSPSLVTSDTVVPYATGAPACFAAPDNTWCSSARCTASDGRPSRRPIWPGTSTISRPSGSQNLLRWNGTPAAMHRSRTPSSCRPRSALAGSTSPTPTGMSAGLASTTSTSTPRCARAIPALRPPIPAPATRTRMPLSRSRRGRAAGRRRRAPGHAVTARAGSAIPDPGRHADLGGDAGAEPRDQAPRALLHATVLEDPTQRVEYHGTGDVPVVLQRRPAVAELRTVHPEEPGKVVENPGATRMDHVEVEARGVPGPFPRELPQYRRQRLHRRRHPAVQHEMESRRLDVVADPTLGVRDEVRRVALKPRADPALPADDGRGDGVAEQPVGEQVSHTPVGRLVAQRAELARHDEDIRLRIRHAVLVRPVDRASPRRAAQLGDRQLLGAVPEAHGVDEPRGHRRHHEPGARDEYDEVDVHRADAGVAQRLPDHVGHPALGFLLEDRVTRLESRVIEDLADRADDVPGPDTGITDQPQGKIELRVVAMYPPGKAEGVGHCDDVLWYGHSRFAQRRHATPPDSPTDRSAPMPVRSSGLAGRVTNGARMARAATRHVHADAAVAQRPPACDSRWTRTTNGPWTATSSDVQAAEVGPYACWPLTTAVARSARDRHGRILRRSLVSPRAPRRWAKRAGRQPGGTACWSPDAGVTAGRDGAGAAGSHRTFWRPAQGLRPDGVPGPVGSQLELDVVVGLAAPHRGHDLDVHQRHPGRGLPGARHLAGGIEHPAGVLVAAVGLIQDLQQVAGRLLGPAGASAGACQKVRPSCSKQSSRSRTCARLARTSLRVRVAQYARSRSVAGPCPVK